MSEMIHLTHTGVYAGQPLCGIAPRVERGVHFVYASDALIDGDETCPTCRHMARCEDDSCETCSGAVVYSNAFTGTGADR